MQKILQGNTLMTSVDDGENDDDEYGTENILVIAFYLITREAVNIFIIIL